MNISWAQQEIEWAHVSVPDGMRLPNCAFGWEVALDPTDETIEELFLGFGEFKSFHSLFVPTHVSPSSKLKVAFTNYYDGAVTYTQLKVFISHFDDS